MKITLRKSMRMQRCWCAQRQGCGYAQLFPLCPLSTPCASPGGGASNSGPGSHRGQVLSDLPDIHTSFLICLIFLPLSGPPSFPQELSCPLNGPRSPSRQTILLHHCQPHQCSRDDARKELHLLQPSPSAPSPWATLQPSPAP